MGLLLVFKKIQQSAIAYILLTDIEKMQELGDLQSRRGLKD